MGCCLSVVFHWVLLNSFVLCCFMLWCAYYNFPETSSDAIRLAEGMEPHEGRLEVYRDGGWYVVCSLDFYQQEADVVCRDLGFPT